MNLPTPPATAVPLYAGFWRRAAALGLDSLILTILSALINVAFGRARAGALLINVVIACAYFAGFNSSAKQATPGKMVFGVKVSDLAGARIGIGRAIGRFFAMWVSGLIVLIGYLMAALTQKKQALHDMIAGTLVVNANARPDEIVAGGGVMPVTAAVWVVAVLIWVVPFFGGLLAAIAIPQYQDYVVRAKVNDAVMAASALKSEIQQAYAQKQPLQTRSIHVFSPSVESVELNSNGDIVVTLVSQVAGGGRIVITPSIDSEGVIGSWKCSSERVAPKYLPASCRQ